MNEALVVSLARETLMTALTIAGPILMVSLAVGVLVSLVQVATSIQDITLTFVPKIVAVVFTVLFTFTWGMQIMMSFAGRLIRQIPSLFS